MIGLLRELERVGAAVGHAVRVCAALEQSLNHHISVFGHEARSQQGRMQRVVAPWFWHEIHVCAEAPKLTNSLDVAKGRSCGGQGLDSVEVQSLYAVLVLKQKISCDTHDKESQHLERLQFLDWDFALTNGLDQLLESLFEARVDVIHACLKHTAPSHNKTKKEGGGKEREREGEGKEGFCTQEPAHKR